VSKAVTAFLTMALGEPKHRLLMTGRGCIMDNSAELETGKLVEHIGELTRTLLSDGANPGQLVFALTSVAADMGLQVYDDPLETVTALMMAIAHQAGNRLESDEDCDNPDAVVDETEIPAGATIH
jgi:hypothetical protein